MGWWDTPSATICIQSGTPRKPSCRGTVIFTVPAMMHEIQMGLYGRSIDPSRAGDPKDLRIFGYPAFTELLFWPFSLFSFDVCPPRLSLHSGSAARGDNRSLDAGAVMAARLALDRGCVTAGAD